MSQNEVHKRVTGILKTKRDRGREDGKERERESEDDTHKHKSFSLNHFEEWWHQWNMQLIINKCWKTHCNTNGNVHKMYLSNAVGTLCINHMLYCTMPFPTHSKEILHNFSVEQLRKWLPTGLKVNLAEDCPQKTMHLGDRLLLILAKSNYEYSRAIGSTQIRR